MDQRDRQLRREIAIILVVKLIAVSGLWWGFFHDKTVTPDDSSVATRQLGITPSFQNQPVQGAPSVK